MTGWRSDWLRFPRRGTCSAVGSGEPVQLRRSATVAAAVRRAPRARRTVAGRPVPRRSRHHAVRDRRGLRHRRTAGLAVGFFLGESLAAYRMFAPPFPCCCRFRNRSSFPCSFSPSVSASCRRSSSPSRLRSSSSCSAVSRPRVGARRVGHGGALLRATRTQIYLRIYLPAMEPLIVEGLRMGLIFTVTGVLLAEMYGSPRGSAASSLPGARCSRCRNCLQACF